MSISIHKYLVTDAKPHCCGKAMHRDRKFVLLREPPISFRLMGHTCKACGRVAVTPSDLKDNQHRALRTAKRVRPPADLFMMIKKDTRGSKKDQETE